MGFRSALTRLNLTRTWRVCRTTGSQSPNLPLTRSGFAHRWTGRHPATNARNISFWSRGNDDSEKSSKNDTPAQTEAANAETATASQATDGASQAATDIAQSADALSQSTDMSTAVMVSEYAADYLQAFHESVSFGVLPWSATIPLAAVAMRLISFPLVYYNQIHTGRFAVASKEFPRIQYFVRKTPGTVIQKYVTFRRLRNLALKSAGTSSMRVFRWHMVVHLPLVVGASMGMREMARRVPEAWMGDGFGWISDLTASDPTGVLPVMTTGLWLWNLDPRTSPTTKERTSGEGEKKKSGIEEIMSAMGVSVARILQVGSVVSLSVTTELAAGLVLFWFSNGVVTSAQRYALSSSFVRRKMGLLTTEDLKEMKGPAVMEGTGMAVEKVREELSYIQREVVRGFDGERVDERLCARVDKMLQRERWNGRISVDLKAVIREDERDGKKYVAIVRKAS